METTEPTTVKITKTLVVHPKYLTNFKESLHTLTINSLHPCYEEHGYILDVYDIKPIGPKKIVHSNGYLTVPVSIHMTTILPKPGNVYHCCITAIFKEGIVTSYGEMKIFIPEHKIESGWFIRLNTLTNTQKTLTVSDWIFVKIEDVQFNHGNYQCIGQILNVL